jgi:hypothetical protein
MQRLQQEVGRHTAMTRTHQDTTPSTVLPGDQQLTGRESISVEELLRAIKGLPSDKPVDNPKKWYRTQKEHWMGWLSEYDGPGAYGRKNGVKRDARFAYNHIVEPKMLLWLAQASGVPSDLTRAALAECAKAPTLQQQSSIIRRYVPWEVVARLLWPGETTT